jgi:hypothetical protein
VTNIPPTGLYGSGMHDFVLGEAELGTRVATFLDTEAEEPNWFVNDAHYAEYCKREAEEWEREHPGEPMPDVLPDFADSWPELHDRLGGYDTEPG